MRIVIGLLWLPILIASHILWLAIINLLDLPLLLYWQLSHNFQAFLEWLDAKEPLSGLQLTEDDAIRLEERGNSTSADLNGKHTAAQRIRSCQDEEPILEPNAKRIRGLSEPWRISKAHSSWFKRKDILHKAKAKPCAEENEVESSTRN